MKEKLSVEYSPNQFIFKKLTQKLEELDCKEKLRTKMSCPHFELSN